MHISISCLNDLTYDWATAQNWPYQLYKNKPECTITLCIEHPQLLTITHNNMSLQLGPSGQFGQWYAHPPLKHSLIQTIRPLLNKQIHIIDATGGMGRDSLLLAAYLSQQHPACTLATFEINPFMASIIEWQTQHIPLNWQVYKKDFTTLQHADIVIIDPMFPPHPKTAKPQKYTQIIQSLTRDSIGSTEQDLITHAKSIRAKHIICKSPPWISSDIWHIIK